MGLVKFLSAGEKKRGSLNGYVQGAGANGFFDWGGVWAGLEECCGG